MLEELKDEEKIEGPTGYRKPGEAPSTLRKLTSPLQVSGEGYTAPQQISNALTLQETVESNFYSGHISSERQYAVKLLMLKEFERKKMKGMGLDPNMYKLYPAIDTMGAKMALLELQTSNSVEGIYAETFIEGITGNVKRAFKSMLGGSKPKEDPGELQQ